MRERWIACCPRSAEPDLKMGNQSLWKQDEGMEPSQAQSTHESFPSALSSSHNCTSTQPSNMSPAAGLTGIHWALAHTCTSSLSSLRYLLGNTQHVLRHRVSCVCVCLPFQLEGVWQGEKGLVLERVMLHASLLLSQ